MDWQHQIDEWSRPPVGGRNISTEWFLCLPDDRARAFVDHAYDMQWQQPGAKDMARALKLDDSAGQIVMDFGCGFGMDALRLMRGGADVILCDLVEDNVRAAERVLRLNGFEPGDMIVASPDEPFFPDATFDVFHANGVLHHTPYAREIGRRAWSLCDELRLMLYSEHAVERFPADTFLRGMDAVGLYSEWYDLLKVGDVFGGVLEHHELVRPDKMFRCVVLKDIECAFS